MPAKRAHLGSERPLVAPAVHDLEGFSAVSGGKSFASGKSFKIIESRYGSLPYTAGLAGTVAR
jgi:hypothetical protein